MKGASDERMFPVHADILSTIDYPGFLSLVLFLCRCNMRCAYCYNASLFTCADTPGMSEEELFDRLRKARRESWIKAVTITGGEPLTHPLNTVQDLVNICRELKLKVKLDTNGAFPVKLMELSPYVDYVAMDLKFSADDYWKYASFRDMEALQESLKFLTSTRKKNYELRTTFIPEIHTEQVLHSMGFLLAARKAEKWVIQPFDPCEEILDKSWMKYSRPTAAEMNEAAVVLEKYAKKVEVRGDEK